MAETLARSLIRLIVVVAIIAAVYLFLLRPILDTAKDVADDTFGGVESSIGNLFDDAGVDPPNLSGVGKTDAERVLACVKRVQPDVSRMQRCAERFTK